MHEGSCLEMWGGVECTYNRVGDEYFDQCHRTGHATRPNDLDRFAELGIRALRYPVLWERTAPHGLARADWSWADERLARLQALGMRPIVGLVHHGSGPRWTSLVDASFPAGLAEFAGAAAARYPWVQDWTPVNEPLTTARFSGLYGHWYPHGTDDHTFVRALLTQCRGVVLAMRAIRAVNPAARLVQTDDLGKTWSTPGLAYQAEFENDRRWVTFDLLCGLIRRDHPLWRYLRKSGATEADLAWFQNTPCPPDVIGINHYLSSERFLDERLELYPKDTHGGNGRHRYADILAARVRREGAAGPGALLRETWERYRLPIAVTEAHNGCTREEQLRWLQEVWDAARTLRDDGIDLRAVTVWSLLGVHGWDNLVTLPDGCYEPGAFDLRGPQPRPTALAGLIRDLAAGREPSHPLYALPGWWRRSDRLIYGFALDDAGRMLPAEESPIDEQNLVGEAHSIMIVGGSCPLGQAFERLCTARGLPFHVPTPRELYCTDRASVDALFDRLRPWAVVNATGLPGHDHGESETALGSRLGVDDLAVLAAACARRGIALLTFSSDLVFDGRRREPYVESDAVAPPSADGNRQVEAEARACAALPHALVVRTGACFNPWDEQDTLALALDQLALGLSVIVEDDAVRSPTYGPDLVHACLDLLIDGEHGIWHLAHPGALTRSDLLRQLAAAAGIDAGGVVSSPQGQHAALGGWPAYRVLGSERGVLLPSLEHALRRFVDDRGLEPLSDGQAHARSAA